MFREPSAASISAPVRGGKSVAFRSTGSLKLPPVISESSWGTCSRISTSTPSMVESTSLPVLPFVSSEEAAEVRRRLMATLARANNVYRTTYQKMNERIPQPLPRALVRIVPEQVSGQQGLFPKMSMYKSTFVDHGQVPPQRALPHEKPYLTSTAAQR
eukprot:TRINITY_DN23077_c0_g1_i1.p1 TRINITY_DN23077_c0_g1~~TRINITY_DN23077_c0_g1_i1.p1  ORF type:complete len:158 (-),score=12.73 TRINITY_DN23077_c0_g1_i1:569-1042(-)